MAAEQIASNETRLKILEGARSAFLRFGFERTSMVDIAAGAGVSRTALYRYFPTKEDVLKAVVGELHSKTLAEGAAALERSPTLDEALVGILTAKFGQTIELIAMSEHAFELVDATNRLTGPAARGADKAFLDLVVGALKRHGRGADARTTGETLIRAARGLALSEEPGASKNGFSRRLRLLVSWVVK